MEEKTFNVSIIPDAIPGNRGNFLSPKLSSEAESHPIIREHHGISAHSHLQQPDCNTSTRSFPRNSEVMCIDK
jgi:hypothetical protein